MNQGSLGDACPSCVFLIHSVQYGVSGFRSWSLAAQTAPPASTPNSQQAPAPQTAQTPATPTRANILRGAYGPYRANNDLLYYHLDVRVDPEKKFLNGNNTIRFKMLKDDTRIQLDLQQPLHVDKILLGTTELKYEREFGAVFVDFPKTLRAGRVYTIDFYYSGTPLDTGRFGGIAFRKDPSGHAWLNTACEGIGASIWWPNKDQWRDEVENMQISVSIPNELVDVSNGKFMGKTDLGDGYNAVGLASPLPHQQLRRFTEHRQLSALLDHLGGLPLDFYALPKTWTKRKSSSCKPKACLEATSTISVNIRSRRMATN